MNIQLYASVFFGVSEMLLLIFKRSTPDKTVAASAEQGRDAGSLKILWTTIGLSIAAGFALAAGKWGHLDYRPVIFLFSCLLFLTGIVIRWVAILQLGQFFTVDVAVAPAHALKTDGLYKRIRHPSYLGLVMIFTALALSQFNYLAALFLFIPPLLALSYRISIEEAALQAGLGNNYTQYMARTKKLIPFIY